MYEYNIFRNSIEQNIDNYNDKLLLLPIGVIFMYFKFKHHVVWTSY